MNKSTLRRRRRRLCHFELFSLILNCPAATSPAYTEYALLFLQHIIMSLKLVKFEVDNEYGNRER